MEGIVCIRAQKEQQRAQNVQGMVNNLWQYRILSKAGKIR